MAHAIREVARALAWYGLAPYEIWNGVKEDDEEEDGNGIRLSRFTPKRLFRFPKFCVQLVPRADQEKLGKSIVILPERILWLVSMPNELGGYWGHRKIIARLARFNWTAPPFWQDDLGRGRDVQNTKFNFWSIAARSTLIKVASLGSGVGTGAILLPTSGPNSLCFIGSSHLNGRRPYFESTFSMN